MIKKILIICLALTMVFTLAACGGTSKKMDLNEYYTIEFSGTNGAGKATINGYSEFEEDLLQLLGENANLMTISIIEDAIDLELDKKEGLSNGDKVTLTFKVDEDIEEGYDIKITGKPITVTVEGLPEKQYTQYNPFDNLELQFNGKSPFITVYPNDKDWGKNINGQFTLEYPRQGSEYLQNGDKLVVKYTYDENMAERQDLKVVETTKEYTVEGYDYYIQSLDELTEEQFNKVLTDATDAMKAKAMQSPAVDGSMTYYYINAVDNPNVKYLGTYFLTPKSHPVKSGILGADDNCNLTFLSMNLPSTIMVKNSKFMQLMKLQTCPSQVITILFMIIP